MLQVGSYREMLLRARVNDAIRSLLLAGASGRALDHIGITYYRAPRLIVTAATLTTPAVYEDDETYRQRLAIAPERGGRLQGRSVPMCSGAQRLWRRARCRGLFGG